MKVSIVISLTNHQKNSLIKKKLIIRPLAVRYHLNRDLAESQNGVSRGRIFMCFEDLNWWLLHGRKVVGIDRVYDITALSREVQQSEGLDSSLEEVVLGECYLPGACFSLK